MTPKQQRFVEEYLLDLSATQAAIRAGYSKRTARAIGHQLLTKVDIAAAIAEAKDRRSARTGIDADYVLMRLAALEAVNVGDFIEISEDGLPSYNFKGASPAQIAAITTLQIDMVESAGNHNRPRKIKITLPDKLKTLELMGRHVNVGAFVDRQQITGADGGPIQVEDVSALEVARSVAFILAKGAREKEMQAVGSSVGPAVITQD